MIGGAGLPVAVGVGEEETDDIPRGGSLSSLQAPSSTRNASEKKVRQTYPSLAASITAASIMSSRQRDL